MAKTQNTTDKILLNFFDRQLKDRTESDIKHMSKYLSQNYAYFMNLKTTKDFNPQKFEQIIKYAKLEIIPANTVIFNYGEPGNKFYILLKGSVTLYKPEYKEVYLTPYEFYEILKRIKEIELDMLKYERLLEKNSQVLFGNNNEKKDLSLFSKNKFYYNFSKKKFLLEKMEKIGVFGDGFSFGEMALIKRTTRNATTVTNQESLFLTIGKKDYNFAIKELHNKILIKDIDKFVKDFPIFQTFSKELILEILNNLSRKTIYKGDYLFQKGEESDNIYLLKNGIINISFNISFAWFDDFLKYFNDNSGNMIIYLIGQKPDTFSKLISVIEKNKRELNEKYKIDLDYNNPFNYKKWEECTGKLYKDNLLGLKIQEEKLNEKDKIFNINVKNIKAKEIIGLEDAIECKKRFFTAKCISEHADLLIIKTYNLIKICRSLKEYQLLNFLSFLIKKKDIFTFQILNKVKYLEKDIIFSLNFKYDILKGDQSDIKKETDLNRLISVLKIKGFKTNINELLDKEIDVSDYLKYSTACKSFNLHMINQTPKEAINRNKQNIMLLDKIRKENKTKSHFLKLKSNINNIINISNTGINKLKSFSNFKNKNKKSYKIPFSPISTSTTYKYKVLSREKTYDNYKNSYNHIYIDSNAKNDFKNNSNISPDIQSNQGKLFTKLYPHINKTQRKFFKEISNKLLSVQPSPLSSSFNNTETTENEKNKMKSDNNKNQNRGNYFKEMYKKKYIDLLSPKSRDIDNSENNDKNLILKERRYYDRLRKEDKDFYLGERFNKKFMDEYNKIKPIHYQSFLLKSK